METATVVSTPAMWLPDDDILLKSAVEEGASLEALAKGAVPFSRTFTLQEVRDRWYALLYDPEISAQACRHLCPDEADKPEEIKANHRKRKVGTLRKRYHERVKKIRYDFFTSADLDLFPEPNHHNCTSNGSAFQDEPQGGNAVLGDCMSDPFGHQVTDFDIPNQGFSQNLANSADINGVPNGGNTFQSECQDPLLNKNDCLGGFQQSLGIVFPKCFHSGSTDPGKCLIPGGELSNNSNVYTMDFSPPQPSLPLWKPMEDEALRNFNVFPADKTHIAQDVSELPGNSYSKGKRADKRNGDSFINSDAHFDDLPDTLFEDEEDKLFMDVNGNYQVDKSCCDNTLSGMPMDITTLKIGEKAKVVATEPEVASYVEVQASSAPTSSNKPLEHSPGIWHCVLNTEDPDIPCNDDIFLLIHPDAPNSSSAMTSNTKSATDPVSAKEKNNLQVVNAIKRREELAQSSKHSLMLGSFVMPEIGHVHSGGGIAARTETNNSCKDPAPRHKAVVEPTQTSLVSALLTKKSLVSAFERNLEKNPKKVDSGAVKTPAILKGLTRHKETGGVNFTHPEPEANRSISDQEGHESENEDLHFSDIEAMVLDEDLQPYDVDLYFTRKVSKYQPENYKKIIMRLEQCARASIQRAMTSKGAIAVLYGRRSKHFIRKKEVLLGRSTEESVVDIDLGKEGRHNKISRRQAIVRMEDDGSFSLQNLAKNPMLVNGAEVGSRELVALSSSCVIEVRGINFMFESNQKYVKRYLENIARRKQGQMTSFKRLMKQEVS